MQHRLLGLLRQSVYSRLARHTRTCYTRPNRLSGRFDDASESLDGEAGPERPDASTNTMSRFETEVLTPRRQPGRVAPSELGKVAGPGDDDHTAHRLEILDRDSSESPVHGEQEGTIVQRSLCQHVLSRLRSCSTKNR